jgi:hypothetical protein
MDLKPGSRWKSSVCDAEVVIVRPPSAGAVLACGGAPMLATGAQRTEVGVIDQTHAAGSLVGKRYVDEPSGLEALCVKAGAGSLSVDGRPVTAKEAKKLPSSD